MTTDTPLTDADLGAIAARAAAYATPGVGAWVGQDSDPYRCPECDRACEVAGIGGRVITAAGMRCVEHGPVKPRYDNQRAALGAHLSFQPDSCGCCANSGVYTDYCAAHDPDALAAEVPRLLAEVRRLRADLDRITQIGHRLMDCDGGQLWHTLPEIVEFLRGKDWPVAEVGNDDLIALGEVLMAIELTPPRPDA